MIFHTDLYSTWWPGFVLRISIVGCECFLRLFCAIRNSPLLDFFPGYFMPLETVPYWIVFFRLFCAIRNSPLLDCLLRLLCAIKNSLPLHCFSRLFYAIKNSPLYDCFFRLFYAITNCPLYEPLINMTALLVFLVCISEAHWKLWFILNHASDLGPAWSSCFVYLFDFCLCINGKQIKYR